MLRLTILIEPWSADKEDNDIRKARTDRYMEIIGALTPLVEKMLRPSDPFAHGEPVIVTGGPRPAPAVEPEPAPDTRRLKRGYDAFRDLVLVWGKNFGIADAEQPDRMGAFSEAAQENGMAMLDYVKACGGLTKAVTAVFEADAKDRGEAVDVALVRRIAENIAQVVSVGTFPDLADLLEYPWPVSN